MGGELGFDITLTNTIFTSILPLQGIKKIRANVNEKKGGIVANRMSRLGGIKAINSNEKIGGIKSFGGKGGIALGGISAIKGGISMIGG